MSKTRWKRLETFAEGVLQRSVGEPIDEKLCRDLDQRLAYIGLELEGASIRCLWEYQSPETIDRNGVVVRLMDGDKIRDMFFTGKIGYKPTFEKLTPFKKEERFSGLRLPSEKPGPHEKIGFEVRGPHNAERTLVLEFLYWQNVGYVLFGPGPAGPPNPRPSITVKKPSEPDVVLKGFQALVRFWTDSGLWLT